MEDEIIKLDGKQKHEINFFSGALAIVVWLLVNWAMPATGSALALAVATVSGFVAFGIAKGFITQATIAVLRSEKDKGKE